MTLTTHPTYARLVEKARAAHDAGRSTAGITPEDIALARLYAYAFRAHTIGSFHATRAALVALPAAKAATMAARERAADLLVDLADRAMDAIAADTRALLSTFCRYDARSAR